jgi:Predicted membrane protein
MLYMFKRLTIKNLQLIKFSIVGASNTLLSLLSYYLLIHIGLHYLIANTLAFGVGILNSYTLNKLWVFQVRNSNYTTLIKFISLNLFTLSLSSILLMLLISVFHAGKIISQIIVTCTILFINYIINKLWTFSNN